MSQSRYNPNKYFVDARGIVRLNEEQHQPPQPPQPPQQPPYPYTCQPQQPRYQSPGQPQYPQPYPQTYGRPYPYNHSEGSNTCGVVGFILSILAIVFCWIPVLSGILWLAGLILSIIGMGYRPKGLAIAGLIISVLVLIIGLFILIFAYAFFAALFTL